MATPPVQDQFADHFDGVGIRLGPEANVDNHRNRDIAPIECDCVCEPASQDSLLMVGIIFLVAAFILLIAGMILAPILPAITAIVIYTCSTILSITSIALFIGASCADGY